MISIRKAKESDISQLEKLFQISRQETFIWENPSKFKIEDFRKSTEGEAIYIAEDDKQQIIGFISIWEHDVFPFIHHLFIASAYQRQGIGALLIKSLFDWLPRPYRLKCVLKNQNAVAFYRKNNWLEVDRGIGEDGEYLLLELPANQSLSENACTK